MANSAKNNGVEVVVEEEASQITEQLEKTLKQGERLVGPTRRPDGTLRKPIRIRAGYTPQEEVAIYQSKGTLWKKEMDSEVGPPGFDPQMEAKPKSKSVKRNERKKEKRQQIRLAEAQLQKASPEDMKPEQLEKANKLDGWREELKHLEGEHSSVLSKS
ncbi:hypothetical protein SOVF_071280 [Spinacia oleracea]|nr:hypothetical protein SOVF_071280 [Spinacia oleracea]